MVVRDEPLLPLHQGLLPAVALGVRRVLGEAVLESLVEIFDARLAVVAGAPVQAQPVVARSVDLPTGETHVPANQRALHLGLPVVEQSWERLKGEVGRRNSVSLGVWGRRESRGRGIYGGRAGAARERGRIGEEGRESAKPAGSRRSPIPLRSLSSARRIPVRGRRKGSR